jgi:iron complex outermembrane receptor protein
MWKVRPRQRLWAATSRALRTPSLDDRGIRVDYPPLPGPGGLPLFVTILGNPAAKTENHVDAEVGYRLEIGAAASIDVTGFVGRYDNLWTQEQSAPVVEFFPSPRVVVIAQFSNDHLEAKTRGLEITGHWMPVSVWRLDASYTAFHYTGVRLTPQFATPNPDPTGDSRDASVPQRQWQLRSAFSPGTRATISVALFHVGPLEELKLDAYTRADITAEWRISPRLSAMAIGQNLFDEAHAEFGGADSVVLATQVRRSAGLRLKWTF